MKNFKVELFKQQVLEKVLMIRTSYPTDSKLREVLGDKKMQEIIESDTATMIMKEVKPHLQIKTRSTRNSPFSQSDLPHEMHESMTFFMSEETFTWMLNELKFLLEEKKGKL